MRKCCAVGGGYPLGRAPRDVMRSGKLLGAHLVGPEVTELVHSLVLAMNFETTEAELIYSIFPHPTLSEAIHESAMDAFGRALHI